MVNLFAGLWSVVRNENVAKILKWTHANIFEIMSQIWQIRKGHEWSGVQKDIAELPGAQRLRRIENSQSVTCKIFDENIVLPIK